jgi:oxygen-independent coproporphyrinogen-3 oxidase
MDDGTLGIYVHIPFCERVCPYCDFAVVRARQLAPELEDAYVSALLSELAMRHESVADRRLESLYLGGGTPSLLRPESVERIVASLREAFPNAETLEITLEVNPSTVERGRLPGFRAAGVNRLSLGVQSFDDAVLRRLGRAHRADEARTTLRASREAGFEDRSVDLIFAVPGQSLESFGRDLREVIEYGVRHVSVYQLTVEANTPYALAIERRILTLPSEEDTVCMFEEAERRLGHAGLRRYELSNYAKPGFESAHNRRYWERRAVLGLGLGAWSSEPPSEAAPFGARRANVRALGVYLERIAEGALPAAGPPETLDARTARGEAVFLALRTAQGLAASPFEQEFGEPPRHFFAEAIDELRKADLLLEATDGSLRLTPRGKILADSVFAHFV